MEVKYKSANGMFEVAFDAKNQQELFEELASFQEVFELSQKFKIGNKEVNITDIKFRVRTVDGNQFYEMVYQGGDKDLWGYRKAFGSSQQKKGALFPKWQVKEEDKNNYENGGGGWFKYKGNGNGTPAPTTQTQDAGGPGF